MKVLETSTLQSVIGPLAGGATGLDGLELQQLARAIAGHGRRCVRPRPGLSLDELPFTTEPVPWSSCGRFLSDSAFRPGSTLHFAAGDYAIQDAASLLPLTLMQVAPGQHVCDCCAAPGGKSAAILEALVGQGLLVSNEVIASRVDTLQLTLARTGHTNYAITNESVERLASVAVDAFDSVLVDAPCTGQSLVARGKQSLSAFSSKQITHSAARQQSILRSAVELVRPGGRLVYSTCTFAFEENEAVVAWLQNMLPDWQPVVFDELAAWQTPGYEGCYRLWPHRDHCAGGFAAALVRPLDSTSVMAVSRPSSSHGASSPSPSLRSASSSRSASSKSSSASRSPERWQSWPDASLFDEWGVVSSAEPMWHRKHSVHWFDPQLPATLRDVCHSGIEVASAFGDHWQPAHPLATLASSSWFQPHTRLELTDQEALTYLSGTSIHRPATSTSSRISPWCLLQWRGRSLGWSKQVATQLKNHLPKPLRSPTLKLPAPTGSPN